MLTLRRLLMRPPFQCSLHKAACSPTSLRLFGSSALDQQDKIILRGLSFHGYHGALPEENSLGQKFEVDAVLWADLAKAGQSDQLQDTIDYAQAYSQIRHVVEGPPFTLQEALAEKLCQQLLHMDNRVTAVQVYVRKPHCALPGALESVGVEILRRRQPQ